MIFTKECAFHRNLLLNPAIPLEKSSVFSELGRFDTACPGSCGDLTATAFPDAGKFPLYKKCVRKRESLMIAFVASASPTQAAGMLN